MTAVREFMDGEGFLEVETPALQPLYGGATARPFVTKHNALDRTMYLRIADELYLKRLIVGGFDRVYEIAKDFRNEGLSRFHNPEFTMLEFYQAFADYQDMMDQVERLMVHVVDRVLGRRTLHLPGSRRSASSRRSGEFGLVDALAEALGADPMELSEEGDLGTGPTTCKHSRSGRGRDGANSWTSSSKRWFRRISSNPPSSWTTPRS